MPITVVSESGFFLSSLSRSRQCITSWTENKKKRTDRNKEWLSWFSHYSPGEVGRRIKMWIIQGEGDLERMRKLRLQGNMRNCSRHPSQICVCMPARLLLFSPPRLCQAVWLIRVGALTAHQLRSLPLLLQYRTPIAVSRAYIPSSKRICTI